LSGIRDVELPARLEVRRESNPQQALFVEFPLQGRQLLFDIQKITVDELAVGVQDLDGPGLLDDELAIVPGRGHHDQRMGKPLGHYLELHVQSRGGQRRQAHGRSGCQHQAIVLRHVLLLAWNSFGSGRTSDSLALGANRSRERAPRRRTATAKRSEYIMHYR
jgi:hypothetical protein